MFKKQSPDQNIPDQKGMTIIELLVSVAVLTLLMGIISLLMFKAFYVDRYTLEQGMNTAEVQKTIRIFTRNLREAKQSDSGGYMIDAADEFELTFFANIDSDQETERLHYYMEDNQLKVGIAEASGFPLEYPVDDSEIRIIGNGLVNNASQPLFYYYNKEYPIDTANNPLTSPPDIEEIGMVKIDLYVNVNTNQVPDSTHMETFIRPRNIR